MLTEGRDIYNFEEYLQRRSRLEGVQARSPMFDVDLVEQVLRLPPRMSFDPYLDRPLLREGLRGVLPEAVRTRAIKSNYGGFIHDRAMPASMGAIRTLVLDPKAEVNAFVDSAAVRALLQDVPASFTRGWLVWAPSVWSIVSMEMWLREQAGRGAEVEAALEQVAPPAETLIAQSWRPGTRPS